MSQLENQLSRYGAIAKPLEHVTPYSRVFFVGDSDDTGFVNFVHEFPPDRQGVVRVYSSIADSTMIANCEASRGDVIMVMPGHTETLSATLDYNVAGLKVIGLGTGDNRPAITSTADTAIKLTAAGTKFSNFIVRPGSASLSKGIYAGAAGVEIDNCLMDAPTATNYFDQWISADSADRLKVYDNEIQWTGADTAAVVSGIVVNDSPFASIERNRVYGDMPVGSIRLDSDVSDGTIIADNILNNLDTDGTCISIATAANTGVVARNMLATADTVSDGVGLFTAMKWFENYLCNDTAETGTLVPATASQFDT